MDVTQRVEPGWLGRLNQSQKRLIKQALDELVSLEHPNPVRGCHAYSFYGCLLLNGLSGGFEFIPQGGARFVKVAPDPGDGKGPVSFSLDPNFPRDGQREFHYWIVHMQAKEVIDFTTEFIKPEALSIGCPWERPDLPGFIWERPETIWSNHELNLRPDPEMTQALTNDVVRVLKAGLPDQVRSAMITLLPKLL